MQEFNNTNEEQLTEKAADKAKGPAAFKTNKQYSKTGNL